METENLADLDQDVGLWHRFNNSYGRRSTTKVSTSSVSPQQRRLLEELSHATAEEKVEIIAELHELRKEQQNTSG